MLSPAQVIPFLSHADPLVRRQALAYFRACADPGPMTADDLWATIDHLGGVGPATRSQVAHLPSAPQTDASVGRLIDALATAADRDDVYDLRRTARELPLPLLVRHRDAVLGCPELTDVAGFLRRRLDLVDLSADDAWDRLMALGRAMADDDDDDDDGTDDGTDQDADVSRDDEADLLVEAAARHIDVVAAPALATLNDVDASKDWREILAIRVLGAARHGPAAGPLVAKLLVDDDYLRDEAVSALGRIGTADAVDRLVSFAPGQPDDVRSYVDEPIGQIKLPQSEAALLRLLSAETDDQLRGRLLYGLCDLCSLAGLDAARRFIVADPNHPESLDLCEALIATAAMNDKTLPEEPRWRGRLAVRDARVAARVKEFDAGDLGAFVAAMAGRMPGLGGAADREAADDLPPPPMPGEYDPYARIAPIRNDVPKVGRNDPCPCGSGKKHKKCCGLPH